MPEGSAGATLVGMTELTEPEAVRLCRARGEGAPAAFRFLFERHAVEVHRFLRRLLDDHESAEDAVQETFVRVHRGLDGFDEARPLRPWLFSVARNVAIDMVRARLKRPKPVALAEDPVGEIGRAHV